MDVRPTNKPAQGNVNRPGVDSNNTKKGKSSLVAKIVFAVVALLVLIGSFALVSGMLGDKPRSDRYQAVFLDNNQVFFGKLKNTSGSYLTLENAYYTKSQELPEDATKQQEDATSNNVSIVKVGSEVYGPENTLKIRSEQVLFWQDLTPESKVTKAIDSDKK